MAEQRSLRGLDWLNFFVANVQTGFGPFIAVYLTENRWTTAEIGFALTIGTKATGMTDRVLMLPSGNLLTTTKLCANALSPTGATILPPGLS